MFEGKPQSQASLGRKQNSPSARPKTAAAMPMLCRCACPANRVISRRPLLSFFTRPFDDKAILENETCQKS
jgi:hypothetical protein